MLKEKRGKIETAFTFNMKELADLMDAEGFISESDHGKVTEFPSVLTDKQKAGIMLASLIRKVELNPKNYYKFLEWIKKGGKKFRDVVDLLDIQPAGETCRARIN